MSLFKKLGEAISANIHNAIDENTNPAVMAQYYVDKAEEELNETRKQTAEVMADRKAVEREISETKNNIDEMQKYAEKAMSEGNRDDARVFLEKKNDLVEKLTRLESNLNVALENEKKMISLCEKQTKDYDNLVEESNSVRANVSIANTQRKLNSYDTSSHSKASFRKMKDKSTRMVDVAMAEAEVTSSVDNIKSKYDVKKVDIEKELDALAGKVN